MSRVSFLIREALVNLRRNALVVTGAVLAVFISLALAFGALIINELVRVNTLAWQQGTHVIVWLKDIQQGVSDNAHTALLAEVGAWSEVESVVYFDKAMAFEEFKELFADRPDFIEEIDPSILPASLRISLVDIDTYRDVQFRLAASPAVFDVDSLGDRIEQLSSLSRVLNVLGLGLASVLGLSAVILIANTIRMAIYARRDEVSIMKLVGASNWFIRVPFLLEGLIEGLLGAALAVFAVWLATSNLQDLGSSIRVVTFNVTSGFFYRWGVLFLFFGAAAGVLGSLVGLRRFLKEGEGQRPIVPRRVPEQV